MSRRITRDIEIHGLVIGKGSSKRKGCDEETFSAIYKAFVKDEDFLIILPGMKTCAEASKGGL